MNRQERRHPERYTQVVGFTPSLRTSRYRKGIAEECPITGIMKFFKENGKGEKYRRNDGTLLQPIA